jgi:polyhydroxybutyrate depolymerase
MIRSTQRLRLSATLCLLATLTLSPAALGDQSAESPAPEDTSIDLGRGPVLVRVPADYDPATPAPLVLLLHGYSGNGAYQETYMQFAPLVDEFGFFYLHPDGTTDANGNQFWNATNACCDFYNTNVDDSGYLRALIDEMKSLYNIDDRRVYLIGHSNGGFMSYRMACEHAGTIAAIASLAGATFDDLADCTPSEPVHILQIHGTADTTIYYNGGSLYGTPYPGAVESAETWAAYDDCLIEADTSAPPMDLERGIPGAETLVSRYETDCLPGGSAELWTIVDGSHIPWLSLEFSRYIIEYFLAHPKASAPCPGDLDGDGDTDQSDLGLLLANYGISAGGDLDNDGDTDQSDVGILLADYNCGP